MNMLTHVNRQLLRVSNCSMPLILSVFTTVAARLKPKQKKGKLNLETKYNII